MSDKCYLCGKPADLEIEVKEANVKKDVCEDCAIRLMARLTCIDPRIDPDTLTELES